MKNQRSSVKFLPPRAVVHACRYCSESCEAEVAQRSTLETRSPYGSYRNLSWHHSTLPGEDNLQL